MYLKMDRLSKNIEIDREIERKEECIIEVKGWKKGRYFRKYVEIAK